MAMEGFGGGGVEYTTTLEICSVGKHSLDKEYAVLIVTHYVPAKWKLCVWGRVCRGEGKGEGGIAG